MFPFEEVGGGCGGDSPLNPLETRIILTHRVEDSAVSSPRLESKASGIFDKIARKDCEARK